MAQLVQGEEHNPTRLTYGLLNDPAGTVQKSSNTLRSQNAERDR